MKRNCPVCAGSEVNHLYRQAFSQMSGAFPMKGYDVVVCAQCGFGFADNTPDQTELDSYYKELSKYENKHKGGSMSPVALRNYQGIVEEISGFLPNKAARIADIGCATGSLLSVFQQAGYSNLQGIDPSSSCAETANELYGIPVLVSSVFDLKKFEAPFDAVIFSSVLEHIVDLNGALERACTLLSPGGLMFIDVPDTVSFASWISAPYQQFSVEHVNFFAPASLINLMAVHGFEPISIWHEIRTLGAVKDPALCTAFRRASAGTPRLSYDCETKAALTRYIKLSERGDRAVLNRVEGLVKSGQRIIVWGTGTQVQRLFATTNFGKARITAFVDSNANYHGKEFNGLPIIAPEDLNHHHEPIVIGTQVFQEEIAADIRGKLQLKNEIIKLFAAA